MPYLDRINWQSATNSEKREFLKKLHPQTISDLKELKDFFDAEVISIVINEDKNNGRSLDNNEK